MDLDQHDLGSTWLGLTWIGGMRQTTDSQKLDLPPGYCEIGLREHRDAFEHAQTIAKDQGAGTLVWVRRFDTIEAAVVLEPEQPLMNARGALFAGMNAVADALGQYCPPEKPLEFSWPDTLMLDGGIIGGCRLAWPSSALEAEPPDWLVLGVHIRSTVRMSALHTFDKGTSLESEGFEIMDGERILESFARHLMAAFDGWRAKGFTSVADRYLARVPTIKGMRQGLDVNGDLLQRSLVNPKAVTRMPLTEALAVPQWLDPETGQPWL
jgi:biotin-(acetyl-CoA carboxylase) ligase